MQTIKINPLSKILNTNCQVSTVLKKFNGKVTTTNVNPSLNRALTSYTLGYSNPSIKYKFKSLSKDKGYSSLLSSRDFTNNSNEATRKLDNSLFNAVTENDIEGIKRIVKEGAEINAFFILNDHRTAILHWAVRHSCINKNLDLVKFLIDNKANIELKAEDGWTPLTEACDEGGIETVKYLISKGANVNVQAGDGESPLHMAINRNNEDLVKLLIESKANIEAKDNDGRTPLAIAAEEGKSDIVAILLESHANAMSLDKSQQTPADLADEAGYHKVARQIRRAHVGQRLRSLEKEVRDLQLILKEDEDNEKSF